MLEDSLNLPYIAIELSRLRYKVFNLASLVSIYLVKSWTEWIKLSYKVERQSGVV